MPEPRTLSQAHQALRALEALRAGVPNRESVLELGTMQSNVVDAYRHSLDHTRERGEWREGGAPGGLLIGGGFGSGKSHLLEYLAQVALDQHFVVSKVVISKETPLHNLPAVFRAAVNDARVPSRRGFAINEIATALKPDSPRFATLFKWLETEGRFIDNRLAATFRIFEDSRGDEDLTARILQYWAGDSLGVVEIRKLLRERGWLGEYTIAASKEEALCRDRISFLSRLITAAGYSGWVILLDEVELVARYSLLQRARSYNEISFWLQGGARDQNAPWMSVLTTVDDYESEVLLSRDDVHKIPLKLQSRPGGDWPRVLSGATNGMRLLSESQLRLTPPDDHDLDQTYQSIKRIHGEAFGWDPPDVSGLERLPSNRMRQYVRSWINEWDLLFLDPTYRPETQSTDVTFDLAEDLDVEGDIDNG